MHMKMTQWARPLVPLVAAILLALGAAPASAGNPVEPGPTATIPATATTEPTKTDPPPDPTATTPAGGGIVVETPTPTEEQGSIAPGFVTVVVWTSDGGPLPGSTTICVGRLCQPGGGLSSGTKIVFDRVDAGWNDVSVRGGAPYGDASASVQVVQGQGSRVELTIDLQRPVEVTPTERASGPLRDPIVVSTAQGEQAWDDGAGDGAGQQQAVQVSVLPETGSGQAPDDAHAVYLALGAFLLVTGAAIAVRRRTRSA